MRIIQKLTTPGAAKVVSTAMTMPAMPKMLPNRADSGLLSPRSARMNNTAAIR